MRSLGPKIASRFRSRDIPSCPGDDHDMIEMNMIRKCRRCRYFEKRAWFPGD